MNNINPIPYPIYNIFEGVYSEVILVPVWISL
jgi:hypothetical protein